MKSLLSGRIFYVVLVFFVVVIYVLFLRTGAIQIIDWTDSPQAPLITESMMRKSITLSGMKEAMRSDRGTEFGLIAVGFYGLIMFLGGLYCTSWGLATRQNQKVWIFPTRRFTGWSYGDIVRILIFAGFVLLLLPFVRSGILMMQPHWRLDIRLWSSISMLVLDSLIVLMALVLATGKAASWKDVFGLRFIYVKNSVLGGLRAYMTLFPWLVMGFALIATIAQAVGYEPPVQPIHELMFVEGRPGLRWLTIFLACFVGPVAEEVFFRGVLYTALRRRQVRWLAMLISGALFAAIHMNVLGFLPILVLGGLFAYLYEKTGSLLSPMVVHIVHNSFMLTLALLLQRVAAYS